MIGAKHLPQQTIETASAFPAAAAQINFEPLLSPKAASDLLQVHPVTLRKWARQGRVPSHNVGRKVMFRASELNVWLTSTVGYNQPIDCAPERKGNIRP
jgi:excisionase family DNA binding protein